MCRRNGKPHERANPFIVSRFRQILEPTRTEEEHEAELLEDQDTTWFGYGRDASNVPQLYDYGRFSAILAETRTEETGERYPQLASFIGETGMHVLTPSNNVLAISTRQALDTDVVDTRCWKKYIDQAAHRPPRLNITAGV